MILFALLAGGVVYGGGAYVAESGGNGHWYDWPLGILVITVAILWPSPPSRGRRR